MIGIYHYTCRNSNRFIAWFSCLIIDMISLRFDVQSSYWQRGPLDGGDDDVDDNYTGDSATEQKKSAKQKQGKLKNTLAIYREQNMAKFKKGITEWLPRELDARTMVAKSNAVVGRIILVRHGMYVWA